MNIEIVTYGDFDIPQTDSIWTTNSESFSLDDLKETLKEFWDINMKDEIPLSEGGNFSHYQDDITITIRCMIAPNLNEVAYAFKDFLRSKGWQKIKTMSITFSD